MDKTYSSITFWPENEQLFGTFNLTYKGFDTDDPNQEERVEISSDLAMTAVTIPVSVLLSMVSELDFIVSQPDVYEEEIAE